MLRLRFDARKCVSVDGPRDCVDDRVGPRGLAHEPSDPRRARAGRATPPGRRPSIHTSLPTSLLTRLTQRAADAVAALIFKPPVKIAVAAIGIFLLPDTLLTPAAYEDDGGGTSESSEWGGVEQRFCSVNGAAHEHGRRRH